MSYAGEEPNTCFEDLRVAFAGLFEREETWRDGLAGHLESLSNSWGWTGLVGKKVRWLAFCAESTTFLVFFTLS